MLNLLSALLPCVAGVLAFGGVLLLIMGLATMTKRDAVTARLEEVTKQVRSLEEIEMQAPVAERFFKPLADNGAKLMARITPSGVQEGTQQRIMKAGLSGRMQASDFMGTKALMTGGGALAFLAMLFLLHPPFILVIVLGVVCLGGGFFGPELWLSDEIKKRRKIITNALPDIIDLLTISVEAGLGFDQALQRVVAKSDNLLSLEFARVLQEMKVGISRRDALRALVERTGVDDVSVFVTAIIQAEQLGASVGKVLRIQSADMRVRRRQRAETLAHQAPIKMLFPMAFFIFPPIFIVVLGPSIPRIIRAFAPGFPL